MQEESHIRALMEQFADRYGEDILHPLESLMRTTMLSMVRQAAYHLRSRGHEEAANELIRFALATERSHDRQS